MRANALVSGADDLAIRVELLKPVSAPAWNAADGEKRCEEIGRNAEHFIDQARIEVHVDTESYSLL